MDQSSSNKEDSFEVRKPKKNIEADLKRHSTDKDIRLVSTIITV